MKVWPTTCCSGQQPQGCRWLGAGAGTMVGPGGLVGGEQAVGLGGRCAGVSAVVLC